MKKLRNTAIDMDFNTSVTIHVDFSMYYICFGFFTKTDCIYMLYLSTPMKILSNNMSYHSQSTFAYSISFDPYSNCVMVDAFIIIPILQLKKLRYREVN